MNAVDPRLALLLRAAVKFELVDAGLESLDVAFDGLIEPFLQIIFPRPANDAEAYWDAPGWSEAARQYHANRKLGCDRRRR